MRATLGPLIGSALVGVVVLVACGTPPAARTPRPTVPALPAAPADDGGPASAGAEAVSPDAADEVEGAEAAPDAAAPPDAGIALAAAAACPASYEAASTAHSSCGMRASPGLATCPYPEGTCTCAPLARCGGARPPPPRPIDYVFWQCVPKVPPKPHPGPGCPPELPKNGSPCSTTQTCHYGEGCAHPYASCYAGKWQTGPWIPP